MRLYSSKNFFSYFSLPRKKLGLNSTSVINNTLTLNKNLNLMMSSMETKAIKNLCNINNTEERNTEKLTKDYNNKNRDNYADNDQPTMAMPKSMEKYDPVTEGLFTNVVHLSDFVSMSSEMISSLLEFPMNLLKEGHVVAMPTETVYGLAANAFDPLSVGKIFKAKGRPSDNPLIVHISSKAMLSRVTRSIPAIYEPLMDAFWPGPITFILPKSDLIPSNVTAGHETVAVRMPSHPIAIKLIELLDCPLAAPSANLSGKPSPTIASHVMHDLQGIIPCIIDGGPCFNGLESTVVNLLVDPPMILRPGSITLEMIRKYVPNIQVFRPITSSLPLQEKSQMEVPAISSSVRMNCPSIEVSIPLNDLSHMAPLAPGMKYTHYAPDAKFIILSPKDQDHFDKMIVLLSHFALEFPNKIGLLLVEENPLLMNESVINSVKTYRLGNGSGDAETIGHNLFKGMRYLDSLDVSIIFMRSVSEANEGLAVMNRITKAASLIIHSEETLRSTLTALFDKDC